MSYLCRMKKITIKKGNHLSISQPLSIPCVLPKESCYIFSFTQESKYILNDGDQQDWNKLIGYSVGLLPTNGIRPAHYNSIRVGWSYDPIKDCFLVSPYWYDQGKRMYHEPHEALTVKTNEEFVVEFYKHSNGVFILQIENLKSGRMSSAAISLSSNFGYLLPPYFGGNKPAPNDISYNKE